MAIQTHVSIITRVYQQQGVMIYYPEVFGLENLHVQQTINYSIVQLAQQLINQQYQQQDVDHFAEMIGTYEIKTNERGILSLTLSNYAIAPQHANGLTITKSLTFDVKTGKTYQLKSLFKPGSDYVDVLSSIVRRQIEERDIPIINGFSQISPDQDFYIADKSLVLYFQPIEITPHYFGSPMFPISVYELADIIDEEGPLGRMMGA
ncbi:MAG TPA: RsiV family protein [Candidatus Dormibacteraeota bacterium]|nr:RsiV family protein [Candidatus Dormibacteraeota bacterium]